TLAPRRVVPHRDDELARAIDAEPARVVGRAVAPLLLVFPDPAGVLLYRLRDVSAAQNSNSRASSRSSWTRSSSSILSAIRAASPTRSSRVAAFAVSRFARRPASAAAL